MRQAGAPALALAAMLTLSVAACGTAGRTTSAATTPRATPPRTTPPPTTRTATTPPTAPPVVAVRIGRTPYGLALTDRRGFALYRFSADRGAGSTCYGACATAWPPYLVPAPRRAVGRDLDGRRLGTARRRDGRLQVTYAGHPLYYYVGDRRPGQVLCQAVSEYGGSWNIVARDGSAIR